MVPNITMVIPSLLEMAATLAIAVQDKSIVQRLHAKRIVKMMMIVILEIFVLKIHVMTIKELAKDVSALCSVYHYIIQFVVVTIEPMVTSVKLEELV
jgi:hypothetical protein